MKPAVVPHDLKDQLAGVLFGTAVGDALGLPAENLSPERIERLWGGKWRMRFIFGRGMVSDDTEHSLLVAQALLSEPDDPGKFQRALAWKLRWWFAALPAGVGLATAKACIRLWVGFPAGKAGVRSAGSGPAMRSAILGAYFADDPERRRDFVLAGSRLTHRGWQAETAALAVAECAAHGTVHPEPPDERFLEGLHGLSGESEWQEYVAEVQRSLSENLSVRQFASRIGLSGGVTGYSLHVVIVAIYGWLRHWGDFRGAVTSVLKCGGDTDTAGAVVGAIAGASNMISGIPEEWMGALLEWPRTPGVMRLIAERLAEQRACKSPLGPVGYFWPGLPVRNIFFLAVVLLHGFRRLLPPY